MRIGIDARELAGRPTGVGRYLGSLLGEWAAELRSPHEFILYAPEAIEMRLDGRRFPTRLVSGSSGTWWEQVRLPAAARADDLDVFFAPAYTAPLRLAVPMVVTIHDISFTAHPEWFRLREGARRRWLTRRTAKQARTIISVSDFTRRELVERLNIDDARIVVIPSGVNTPGAGDWGLGTGVERSSPRPPAPSLHSPFPSLQPPAPSPNVLYVGSVFNRRHVVDLIRAFAPLAHRVPNATLDIVGDNRSYPREDLLGAIAAEGLEGRARWHEYVSDADLGRLYARAGAFAFLSEYEGLGMTPLEALAAGVPSVLLDTPVAHESCGGAALFVPLADLPATTDALERLLFDEQTRARLLAAAPAVLGRYRWPRAARQTLDVLEAAAHA